MEECGRGIESPLRTLKVQKEEETKIKNDNSL